MARITIDMSDQPAGAFFSASTDWTYDCKDGDEQTVIDALAVLGIPAALTSTEEKA